MRSALEHLLDFIERPSASPLETLLFTAFALGAAAGCLGLMALATSAFGLYALAVLAGGVLLACIYEAGVSHGRQRG